MHAELAHLRGIEGLDELFAGPTAIAFVTGWMLLGYNRALVWELPFFGPDFVLWRIIVSLPIPIIAGLLGRIAVRAFALRMESESTP